LVADEDGEDALDGLAGDKDEKTFLVDETLHFRLSTRDEGELVFAWRDLSGDVGDLYEFVCDEKTPVDQASTFEHAAIRCQYEKKFKKSHETASDKELEQFSFKDEKIPQATNPNLYPSTSNTSQAKEASPTVAKPVAAGIGPNVEFRHQTLPEDSQVLVKELAELHIFDVEAGGFVLQDGSVVATVLETGPWTYWLEVTGKDRTWDRFPITNDLNPVWNLEMLSFIFTRVADDGTLYSELLRVKDQPTLQKLQESVMGAFFEQRTGIRWNKTPKIDQEFQLDAYNDVTMEDAPEAEEEESEEEPDSPVQETEEYDSDESQDDVEGQKKSGDANSQLAVGFANDRSFVVRGSSIGVFKHTPSNKIQHYTTINKVQTPKGSVFSPKKVMLHARDRDMVIQDAKNPHSLYKMDLEYGKIVDEWKVHDDIPITAFAPDKKLAQMTDEATFLGLSGNALFRVDPRLSGNKLVDSQLKQYASKNDFSAISATSKGHIAVASNKGDIRLYDRLGINAKTQIPALGEPIIGIDVSANGQYILATCKTYLLLIDAEQKDGKNAGKLGFEKSFAKDAKPQPKRLTLTPQHTAQVQHETGASLNFTTAHFNTDAEGSKETSIISSTGPYIVTWNLKKVLSNQKGGSYTIKRYTDEVKADNFKFGSDKNVIVALPHDVDMVAKSKLLKPTRESIGLVSTPRKSVGRESSRLRKSEIVNSPY
jgi:hypothetical protein